MTRSKDEWRFTDALVRHCAKFRKSAKRVIAEAQAMRRRAAKRAVLRWLSTTPKVKS